MSRQPVSTHINTLFEEIDQIKLAHPAATLLRSLVTNALDQALAARYVSQRLADDGPQPLLNEWVLIVQAVQLGSAPLEPDAEIREAVIRRDGAACCITGKAGSSRDPLVIEPVLPLPVRWLEKSVNHELLGAFLTPPYRDWWLSRLREPELIWPLSSHWLVTRTAADAYKAGSLRLERLQPSAIEYEVRHNRIGPETPLGLQGSYPLLGDHSRCRLQSVDPRLVGTHSRFSESIRLIGLAHYIAPEILPSQSKAEHLLLYKAPIKSLPTVRGKPSLLWKAFYRCFFPVWRSFPDTIRLRAYQALLNLGRRLYGQPVELVQRLPFGLYMKYGGGEDESRNEFNALQVVQQNTTIPVPRALDLVMTTEHPGDSDASKDAYLLMSCLPGIELARCQSFLSDAELEAISKQLKGYISELRSIPALTTATPTSICNTIGEACRDPRVQGEQPVGPFPDEATFSQVLRFSDDSSRRGHRVVFTHADLNPRNILISPVRVPNGGLEWAVTGIVDWTNSGYYPEYWDYTKAMFERFRWPRRYNEMVKRTFQAFGDYSEELDIEVRSWESGDGV